MNKSILITQLVEKNKKSTFKDMENFVNNFFNILTESLIKEERIELRDFGSFTIRHYKSYKGINPKTGESIIIPEKKLPYWKTGRSLKERADGIWF